MKMITAIINKKDSSFVCSALRAENIAFTKVASVGGFLSSGNATLIIGLPDEKVETAMSIIRSHCSQRMEPVPHFSDHPSALSTYSPYPAKVLVGGATVFITDVAHFEKM